MCLNTLQNTKGKKMIELITREDKLNFVKSAIEELKGTKLESLK
jgi:hypothetical protein